MKWCLPFDAKPIDSKINIGDKCVFLGSCFAQNMVQYGQSNGLTFINPDFGTLFHPEVIRRVLSDAVQERWSDFENRCFQTEDLQFKSWDCGNVTVADSLQSIQGAVVNKAKQLRENLSKAKFLFLTFGSAWYYETNGLAVSNCHKQPQSLFHKKISAPDDLVNQYTNLIELLQTFNPELKVVTTVSPVRHKRDGLIENNRSKSRLLMLCEALESTGCHYFPAYEMVIDQLRDHRFYEADLVHPNAIAVEEVWQQFDKVFLEPKESAIRKEILQVNRMMAHRPMEATSILAHQEAIQRRVETLNERCDQIFWT